MLARNRQRTGIDCAHASPIGPHGERTIVSADIGLHESDQARRRVVRRGIAVRDYRRGIDRGARRPVESTDAARRRGPGNAIEWAGSEESASDQGGKCGDVTRFHACHIQYRHAAHLTRTLELTYKISPA